MIQTQDNRKLATLGLILALFLSAMEISAVGPAAPLIVGELGGLSTYSLLFTSYLITSTVFMPLWGRASDRYGRKHLLIAALALFLAGSLIAGSAPSLRVLLVGRLIQGLGASGLIPISFTAISDMYNLEERTRLQGMLSATWGIASLVGPYIGGALAESMGWRWVFLINLFPGVLAWILTAMFQTDRQRDPASTQVSIRSIVASMAFVLVLMTALELTKNGLSSLNLALWACALLCLILFIHYQRREEHPLIPRELYPYRVFIVGCLSGFFCSGVIIGLASYSPLYFQSVLGYNATASGLLLAPFSVAWVLASIPATRLMLRVSPRKLIIMGHFLTALGFALFLIPYPQHSTFEIVISMMISGTGMAFNYPLILISTQHSVPRAHVGFATSALTWVRNQGATICTALMGMLLTSSFVRQGGMSTLMDPSVMKRIHQDALLRAALSDSLRQIFWIMLFLTIAAMLVSWYLKESEWDQTQDNS